jgi:hypothetical protein
MRALVMLPSHIAGDDGKFPSGRQGREGRDFLSPLEQPFYRNCHIHERRTRAHARVDKNIGDVFSRPSRPSRPRAAVAGLRFAHSAGWRTHPWRDHHLGPLVVVHRMSLAPEIAERAA